MFWADQQMEPQVSDAEFDLRMRFVEQYVIDYDPYQACIRVGFHASLARNYAVTLMSEPVVLQLIRDYETTFYQRLKERDPTLLGRIASRLYSEAMTAPSCSTRVTALSKLANMTGMDESVETDHSPKIYIGIKEDEDVQD